MLELFGYSTPGNIELSDRICTALQIVEHCQDVAEDFAAGRCYVPQEDLNRFDVDPTAFEIAPATREMRHVIAYELDRATALLDDGLPLVHRVHGWARLALAGYTAGGRAAIDAIRRADYDVMSSLPDIRRLNMIRQLVEVLMSRRAAA